MPEQVTKLRPCQYIFYGVVLVLSSGLYYFATEAGHHLYVEGVHGPNGLGDNGSKPKKHPFTHDFFMANVLYLPQALCLIIHCLVGKRFRNNPPPPPQPAQHGRHHVRAERESRNSRYLFIPLALFSYSAICLLFVGNNLTFPSSGILFKGTLLFFTSLLSVAFLGRNMTPRMWVGVVISIIGLAVLGINDYIYQIKGQYDTNGIVAGDLLIVMAQIMIAIKAVCEQKMLTRYVHVSPLEALAFEGIGGFCISFFLVILFSYINAGAFSQLPGRFLESPLDAFQQMKNSSKVIGIVVGSMIFNTIFQLVTLIITKAEGATPRMVINTISCAGVWGLFLAFGWRTYDPYIIPGFLLIILGFCIYFDLIFIQIFRFLRKLIRGNVEEDNEALLPANNLNHRIQ